MPAYDTTFKELAKTGLAELVRFGFGVIPYLGFFSEKSGRDTAAAFQRSGHDTYLRPFEAFSGLGLILSPIYSEMLDGPGPRGGERAAEVAARFALDALPGRQAAIEADLRAGALSPLQARRQRGGAGERV